jgi:hypothetical protein
MNSSKPFKNKNGWSLIPEHHCGQLRASCDHRRRRRWASYGLLRKLTPPRAFDGSRRVALLKLSYGILDTS